ncbi:gamma-glutamyl-gamma-aminobutyrate hydrolase family protein [bacterium]|nr:gamma-glutamyl-gamma-aminobutyrate hydrolase family protein [bacterium]
MVGSLLGRLLIGMVAAGVLAATCVRADGKMVFTDGLLQGCDGLFDDWGAVCRAGQPVVCVVAARHPEPLRSALHEPTQGHGYLPYLETTRQLAERLSGLPAVVVHYLQLEDQPPAPTICRALLLTALDRSVSAEHTGRLRALIRTTDIPILGFCGGLQLIGEAFGARSERLRSLRPGEADPMPTYYPGTFKEVGFLPVRIVKPDPLFAGLGSTLIVREVHAFGLSSLPPELECLAATDECPVQVVRHKTKLIVGTQFHAERFDSGHPDGGRLIGNFLALAGLRAP